MTKKDYVKFAAMLKIERQCANNTDETQMIDRVTYSIACVFADDSPNCDRARFLSACGVGS